MTLRTLDLATIVRYGGLGLAYYIVDAFLHPSRTMTSGAEISTHGFLEIIYILYTLRSIWNAERGVCKMIGSVHLVFYSVHSFYKKNRHLHIVQSTWIQARFQCGKQNFCLQYT
jgi:hypothetical protein